MAAEESRSLVFTYDLKRQTIFVDEQTARTFGVAEVQPDVLWDGGKRHCIGGYCG